MTFHSSAAEDACDIGGSGC